MATLHQHWQTGPMHKLGVGQEALSLWNLCLLLVCSFVNYALCLLLATLASTSLYWKLTACETSTSLHEFCNTPTALVGPLPAITSLCGMLSAVAVHIRAFAGH